MSERVAIWTDGACSGNPGPGGWGAVLTFDGKEKDLCGGEQLTTNNRMELMSVIVALEMMKNNGSDVTIYSDSKYVVESGKTLGVWLGKKRVCWKEKCRFMAKIPSRLSQAHRQICMGKRPC